MRMGGGVGGGNKLHNKTRLITTAAVSGKWTGKNKVKLLCLGKHRPANKMCERAEIATERFFPVILLVQRGQGITSAVRN